jgi:hypothetical protein
MSDVGRYFMCRATHFCAVGKNCIRLSAYAIFLFFLFFSSFGRGGGEDLSK